MRKAEDITAVRNKYGWGVGPFCVICGEPTDSVSIRCERCLESICHGEELEYAARWLREHPETQIEIGWDEKRRLHLVLFRAPHATAWCGARVTQKRQNRKWVDRGLFPPGVCEQCLESYSGVAP